METEHVAWEPIPKRELKEGMCGTCRYLDQSRAYLTNPLQYDCLLTHRCHFIDDECDVPALAAGGY